MSDDNGSEHPSRDGDLREQRVGDDEGNELNEREQLLQAEVEQLRAQPQHPARASAPLQASGDPSMASYEYETHEYDVVVSTGEQVTVGLLAISLQHIGVPARSWLGWQMPFLTDQSHECLDSF